MRFWRVLAGLACVSVLTACETPRDPGHLASSGGPGTVAAENAAAPEFTGSIGGAAIPDKVREPPHPELFGSDPRDDFNLGKEHYRQGDYSRAEQYFRRAVEAHPRDGEAWLGLAAARDRLKRFDLADHAYAKALSIVGPTAEVLNNQGYSYMLRGDYAKARQTLMQAHAADPANPYVKNNLILLSDSARKPH